MLSSAGNEPVMDSRAEWMAFSSCATSEAAPSCHALSTADRSLTAAARSISLPGDSPGGKLLVPLVDVVMWEDTTEMASDASLARSDGAGGAGRSQKPWGVYLPGDRVEEEWCVR